MNQKISKREAKDKIDSFFKNIKSKSPSEVERIRKIAMSHKIPLKEKRKLFCKKCLTPYSGKEKVRIKGGIKTIECKNCSYLNRWKLKTF